jgi:hypothetical protein
MNQDLLKKMKPELMREFEFCLDLWEKQGHCTFGGHTDCENCAAIYLIYKLLTGEVIHGDVKRLTLEEWKTRLENTKGKF